MGAYKGVSHNDLVLFNGEIHTMAGRVVGALTIRNGLIIHVGDELAAARRAAPDAEPVDLRGRTAIPGVIDNHNHLVLMGNRPGHHTPLENAYSIADVTRAYRERARRVPAGEFITTIGGFHVNQFREGRLPTLSELDSALPRHPVYTSVGFNGPSVTNSLGKDFLTSAEVPVRSDGSIATGTGTGKATLALRRTLTFEQRKRGVRDAMAYAASVGVTTHLDQGGFQATGTPSDTAAHEDNHTMHHPFLAVYADGAGIVRLRINFLHMDADPELPELSHRLRNAYPFFGDDLVRAGMSSDGMQIAPMNPFVHAYYATTGRNALGELINDGQQIGRQEALDLYTRANGWFLGGPDENRLGTLEEGRLGDVAVLDRDYFTVPDEELRAVRPVLTVVGGTIVHNSGEVG